MEPQSQVPINQRNQTTSARKYKPLVLSGCSGAGKSQQGTIVKKLLSKYPYLFQLSVSLTTRKPRQGQLEGREYHFVRKEQFEQEITKGIFAQHCQVHGNYYGTHKGKVNEMIQRGKIAILQIDLQGGQKVHSSGLQCQYLFIDIPSLEILRERLTKRGTDSQQTIEKRMKNAVGELEHVGRLGFYTRVMNDELERCFEEICGFVGERYGVVLKE